MWIVFPSSARAYCKTAQLLVYLDIWGTIGYRQNILQHENEMFYMYTMPVSLYGDFYH
jgi:hypothetical protein